MVKTELVSSYDNRTLLIVHDDAYRSSPCSATTITESTTRIQKEGWFPLKNALAQRQCSSTTPNKVVSLLPRQIHKNYTSKPTPQKPCENPFFSSTCCTANKGFISWNSQIPMSGFIAVKFVVCHRMSFNSLKYSEPALRRSVHAK